MTAAPVVIGAGGLLGRAVADRLAAGGAAPVRARVDWSERRASVRDIRRALDAEGDPGALSIFWCAGAGVTSTPRSALEAEASVFDEILEGLASSGREWRLFFASSVGGIWAGAHPAPFDEATPPAPLSAYGEVKLRMERSAGDAARASRGRALVGRLSNIYGPGQNMAKAQGLLSVIARASVTNQPVPMYVSLDTVRDYIHADDAARVIVAGTARLGSSDASEVTKIIASGMGMTIASVLGEFQRVRHRRPLVVSSQRSSAGQALDLRVRSRVWTDLDALVTTSIAEGIQELLRHGLLTEHSGSWVAATR